MRQLKRIWPRQQRNPHPHSRYLPSPPVSTSPGYAVAHRAGSRPTRSLCPPQRRGDAGRLCRRDRSLRQQEPQLYGGYGARTLDQACPWATLGWHLAEHRSDAVTTISPLSKHQLCRGTDTRTAFRFSAVGFRTTHKHVVLFSQTTRHPWLVCS